MLEEEILFEKNKERKIATITFNRPEKRNAFTRAHWEKLIKLIDQIEWDDDVKVVIFKGNGECFGSGHDVGELGFLTGFESAEKGRPSLRRSLLVDRNVFWGRKGVMQSVLHCLKPTIAQVHGYCYGGHWELAMNCDIVIASEEALFTHPGFRFLGPTTEMTLWIEIMGLRKMKEMVLTGRPVGAQEAENFGLITKMVPRNKLEETVNFYAEQISLMPFDGLVAGKAQIEAALDIRGISAGETLAAIGHGWQLRLKFEPGEFNLLRSRKEKGVKGAIIDRDSRFAPEFQARK